MRLMVPTVVEQGGPGCTYSFADCPAGLQRLEYKPRREICQMKGIGHGITANTQFDKLVRIGYNMASGDMSCRVLLS
jgi:hypothetical protein